MKQIPETDYKTASDDTLAEAFKKGDVKAFETLVSRHQGHIYRVAYTVALNREDALEITQDVFVKVYRNIHRWEPTGPFVSWLTRLAVNQAIDLLRKRRRHLHDTFDEKIANSTQETGLSVRSRAYGHEIGERIQEAMKVLSPAQRTVFVLRHYEGMQLAEIAEALGCTIGSIKVHLFRAIKKLQEELKELR